MASSGEGKDSPGPRGPRLVTSALGIITTADTSDTVVAVPDQICPFM